MPRPSEPTRARIVQAASALFYNEGIRRVSVDEVAAKAGTIPWEILTCITPRVVRVYA